MMSIVYPYSNSTVLPTKILISTPEKKAKQEKKYGHYKLIVFDVTYGAINQFFAISKIANPWRVEVVSKSSNLVVSANVLKSF